MKSASQIDSELKALSLDEVKNILPELKNDERPAVLKLITKYEKQIEKLEAERARTYTMFEFERKFADYSFICGIDEVGRGPLAGPVYAGAVILPRDKEILYLNDSKKLSEKKREELYDIIMNEAVAVAVGCCDNNVIDELNILNATYEAMRKAIASLNPTPDILLNDYVHIPKVDIKQISIVHGDARSASIAAASIVAKVTRDHVMYEFDKEYPQYGFASNKGYGTAEHIEALKKYGPTPIHRKTFISNLI